MTDKKPDLRWLTDLGQSKLRSAPIRRQLVALAATACALMASMTTSAEIINSYDFDGDLSDTLGNGVDLTDAGGTVSAGRYSFSDNQGLRLTSALQSTTDYAIELRFQVNDNLDSWNKLIDYEELALDFGLYVYEGGIDFWTVGPALGILDLNTDVTVAISRAGGVIEVFVNGASLFTAEDPNNEAVSASNILNFFEDDVQTGQAESFTGSVDFIRIHEDASTLGTEPDASTTFSIVVIPDTQMYVEAHPEVFEAQMDWIVANKNMENIIYVAHLGDLKDDLDCDVNVITEGTGNQRTEWQIVDQALKRLDDNTIPFGVVPGNHDYDSINNNASKGCPNFSTQRPLVEYNKILGPERFAGKPHYGDPGVRAGNRQNGQMEDGELLPVSNEDNFVLLEGTCGVKLIAVNLGYHEAASPTTDLPEIDWADGLLKAYPDRLGILTSHYFIDENPGDAYGSYGQQVRDRLADNPNLMMMLSAHERGEAWKVDTGADRDVPDRIGMQPIHALLSDYQSVSYLFKDGDPNTPEDDPTIANIDFTRLSGSNSFGDAGFMRIMRFDPVNEVVSVETFIPPVVAFDPVTGEAIKNRPDKVVSTYFPASGAGMNRNTASNFSMSFEDYGVTGASNTCASVP